MKARYIVELPSIKSLSTLDWFEKVKSCFFFSNQAEIFDCFLFTMNDKVYISFNTKNALSRQFVDFVLIRLPKKQNDKKRRFFKSK